MRGLFRIISFLFHPLVLPLYGFTILVAANPSEFFYHARPINILRQFAFNAVLFPMFTLLLLIALGFVRDVYMAERRQRIAPLITTMFFYSWAFVMFSMREGIPGSINYLTLGSLIAVSVALLVTVAAYKVSLHTLGMGVLMGLTLLMAVRAERDILLLLLATIIAAGWVGTSRLVLGQHTHREVYSGYLFGVVSQFAAFLFLG